jgi:hypothetical protein
VAASNAQRAATADRRAKAIAMKLAGVDFQVIADRLGYSSRGAATKDVHRALEANLAEEAAASELLRHQEAARLDRLQAAVWTTALSGDVRAIETVLKISAQRARLLGLNAPEKHEVITLDYLDAQIRDATEELARAAAAEAADPS